MKLNLIISGLAALVLSSIALDAGEFLVFQGERTFAEADRGFHYYFREGDAMPKGWPADWREPVDYWDGVWYLRVELKDTPEGLPVTLQPCIWMHDESGNSSIAEELESCGGPYLAMDAPGVYTVETRPMQSWWHKNRGGNAIDISRPHHFKRVGLVLRTDEGCYVTPYNVTPNCWEQREAYLPMTFHLAIVAVAEGTEFSGWDSFIPPSEGNTAED